MTANKIGATLQYFHPFLGAGATGVLHGAAIVKSCVKPENRVLKLLILPIMKGIANLNTRKGLCGETRSNLGDRQLWEQGAAEPCQNW